MVKKLVEDKSDDRLEKEQGRSEMKSPIVKHKHKVRML